MRRLIKGAFITPCEFLGQRLFEGGVYLRAAFNRRNTRNDINHIQLNLDIGENVLISLMGKGEQGN